MVLSVLAAGEKLFNEKWVFFVPSPKNGVSKTSFCRNHDMPLEARAYYDFDITFLGLTPKFSVS